MHLSTPYDPHNIFAKILRGEMPSLKVYEDEVCLAFLDIFPQGPGHTLVIPKIAATNLLTMPSEALGPYMTSVQKVARAVQKAFQAEGLTVLQFNGSAGGQTVFHVHFHLIPRQEAVGLIGHGQAGKASEEDLISHQAAILAAF
jgi:histidine triad (HIT) family protein